MAKVAGRRKAGRIVDKTGLAQLIVYAGGNPLGVPITHFSTVDASSPKQFKEREGIPVMKAIQQAAATHTADIRPRDQLPGLLKKSTLNSTSAVPAQSEATDATLRSEIDRLQASSTNVASFKASSFFNNLIAWSIASLTSSGIDIKHSDLDFVATSLSDATSSAIAAFTIDGTKVDMNNREIGDVLTALRKVLNVIPSITAKLTPLAAPAAPGGNPTPLDHRHVLQLRADHDVSEFLSGLAKFVPLYQKAADNKIDKDLIAGAAGPVVIAQLLKIVGGAQPIGHLPAALGDSLAQIVEKRPILRISSDRLLQVLAFGNLAVLFESPRAPSSFSGTTGATSASRGNLPESIVSSYIEDALEPLAYQSRVGDEVNFVIPTEMLEVTKYLVYQGISQEALANLMKVAEPRWTLSSYGVRHDTELFEVEEAAIAHALQDLALLDSKITRADLLEFIKGDKIPKTHTPDLSLAAGLEVAWNNLAPVVDHLMPRKDTNAYRTLTETVGNLVTHANGEPDRAAVIAALSGDATVGPQINEIIDCGVQGGRLDIRPGHALHNLEDFATALEPELATAETADPVKGRALRVIAVSQIQRMCATVLAKVLPTELAAGILSAHFRDQHNREFRAIRDFISFRGYTKAKFDHVFAVTNVFNDADIATYAQLLKAAAAAVNAVCR